ncbi:helix-turn-helix domain-containing protein [Pectobacterium aroidearum]|uniref:helix-turn-helix domain-containing protein n=1 Tax=Pectobacterium aroidearum TaxID=1201031 RepID=UPI0035194563
MVNAMTIDNQENGAQAITPIARLAVAIRRERERLNLSVTELAKRAGLAKSTLSQLETGIGNPSLETLWALAMALDVQVSQLIGQSRQHVQVIRANEGVATYSEQANYAATLLAACPAGAQRDIYRLNVQPGEARVSQPHRPGTIEHVILSSGRARIGPVAQPVELSAGDYISYSADVPHLFDALEEDTSAVMLIEQG